MSSTRVAVVFGGRSVEHEISILSARAVTRALEQAGFEAVAAPIASDGVWLPWDTGQRALDGELDALPAGGGPVGPSLARFTALAPTVVFPLVHGTWGEDGTLQGLLEMLDLPYVGAGVGASALAMDKVLAKRQLAAAGVPVVESVAVSDDAYQADRDTFLAAAGELGSPLFVKPAVGGSSVGVRKVGHPDELDAAIRFAFGFDDRVLIERGIRGRELEASVLGFRRLEAAEAIGEIRPGREFYDYEDKYLTDTAELVAPAPLPPAMAERVRRTAVDAFRALGGEGMARVDFLLEGDDRLYVNEINTLPGFTRISMYPRLWDLSGVPMPELVRRLVEIAVERHRARRRLDEGIKEFLRELHRAP